MFNFGKDTTVTPTTKQKTMIKSIEVNDGIVVVLPGRSPIKVASYDYRFNAVRKAVYQNDLDALEEALGSSEIEIVVEEAEVGDITASPEGVFYKGQELHGTLVDKITSLLREGYSADRFMRFLNRLERNPRSHAVNELYDFMQYKELPIDEDGRLIAYKGVRADGFSITGNKNTIVLQGNVNSSGHILNRVGDTIEVKPSDVDDDRNRGCSYGLHVGSWDYASGFAQGLILVVAIDPADVVSVPHDCNYQKMRVSKYEVLETVEQEIESPAYGRDSFDYMKVDNGFETLDEYLTSLLSEDEEVYLEEDVYFEFGLDSEDERQLIQALARNGYRVLRDGRIVFDD